MKILIIFITVFIFFGFLIILSLLATNNDSPKIVVDSMTIPLLHKQDKWPTHFALPPRVGDYVQSDRLTRVRILKIIHAENQTTLVMEEEK